MGLFIPKKIRVGFDSRPDTFTGKLAYIIYYDEKGKIRKEASFNSWCDASLGTLELDNEPRSGFVLNKGVKRDHYWGSGRSMIRVHDDRGFEFEITITNLMGVLMHSDVSKRDIVESCVYAWEGTELVLLPCNSQEYLAAMEFTANQDVKLTAKDLKVGAVYKGKKDEQECVYMGHMAWEGPTKKHVFFMPSYKFADPRQPDSVILVSEEKHPDFDKFLIKTTASQKVEVQKMSPKLLKLGGVYKKLQSYWGNKTVEGNFVYIGQFDYPTAPIEEHRTSSYRGDDFKRRAVFYDTSKCRFYAVTISDIQVNLNPDVVSNIDEYLSEFRRTCATAPLTAHSQESIELDENNMPEKIWAVFKFKDPKPGFATETTVHYEVLKTNTGYRLNALASVSIANGTDYWFDYSKRWGNDTNKLAVEPQNNGNLSLQDLKDMNPVQLYVTNDTGVLLKREDVHTQVRISQK